MKDCHVHTDISYNGVSTINEYLDVAKEKNVDEITLTEYYSMRNDTETLDIDYYLNEYIKYFKDSRLKTNFGLEIDLQPDQFYRINDVIVRYPFDFIIASSHMKYRKCILHELYLNYFNEVLENVKTYDNEFDVYWLYSNGKIDYEEFKSELDEILLNLIEKNKGIELATRSESFSFYYTLMERYKELGGSIVTIGSDAYNTDDLGRGLGAAIDMLEKVGFDEIAVYHKRKPNFVKIMKEK